MGPPASPQDGILKRSVSELVRGRVARCLECCGCPARMFCPRPQAGARCRVLRSLRGSRTAPAPSDRGAHRHRVEAPQGEPRNLRRLLAGQTTSQWAVVDALLRALCQLQDRDPDGRRWSEPGDQYDEDDPETCREYLRRLWNNDIDGLEPGEAPATPPAAPAQAASGWGSPTAPSARSASGGWGGTPSPPADDPWATGVASQSSPQTGGYSDEPPF